MGLIYDRHQPSRAGISMKAKKTPGRISSFCASNSITRTVKSANRTVTRLERASTAATEGSLGTLKLGKFGPPIKRGGTSHVTSGLSGRTCLAGVSVSVAPESAYRSVPLDSVCSASTCACSTSRSTCNRNSATLSKRRVSRRRARKSTSSG